MLKNSLLKWFDLKYIALLLCGAAFIFFYTLFMVDHRPKLTLDIGDFFDLQADLKIQFKAYEKQSLLVEMSDGEKLATDIFIPTEGEKAQEKFPVILSYTPYGRSHIYPPMSLLERVGAKFKKGVFGPVFDASLKKQTRVNLSQGYAYIKTDIRGTGASTGNQMPLDPIIGLDGKELIDWIIKQPWSNGKVCMQGQSYLAWSQFATAQHKPKGLKCIMPALIAFETFTGGTRPGGILAKRWVETYSDYLAGFSTNDIKISIPTTPVIDEDADGELKDEIPLYYEGATPIYTDHDKRKNHFYAQATLDHKKNLLVSEAAKEKYSYIDSKFTFAGRDVGNFETSPGYFLQYIKDSDIGIYNVGGWYDGFIRGTTKIFSTLQGHNGSKLFIGPRFHVPKEITNSYREYFDYKGQYKDQLILESLRFFDHYLKGVDNDINREKPVKIYVMHGGWRAENEWPLVRQVMTPFYFNENHKLSSDSNLKENGVDHYQVNWNHQADYGSNKTNRWFLMEGPDQVMDRTEHDQKTYNYDTAPLTKNTEVTGHPLTHIWLSSNQTDGDIFVYLNDVDEKGRSVFVSEGRLRAGWSKLSNDDDQIRGTIDVKPDLPWQGYIRENYDEDPLKDGKIVHLTFDMEPTSWRFKKGHKIRLSIAGVDKDNFELNKHVCPEKKIENCKETTLSFHREEGMHSHIILPIIP